MLLDLHFFFVHTNFIDLGRFRAFHMGTKTKIHWKNCLYLTLSPWNTFFELLHSVLYFWDTRKSAYFFKLQPKVQTTSLTAAHCSRFKNPFSLINNIAVEWLRRTLSFRLSASIFFLFLSSGL